MTEFEKLYQEKLMTSDDLVRSIPAGSALFTDSCLAQPFEISQAMRRAVEEGKMNEISVNTILEMYPTAWYEETGGVIKPVSWFSGGRARSAVNKGLADVMPCAYVGMIDILRDNPQIDTLCIAVSPMDEEGYFSTGACSALSKGFLDQAKRVYIEVNDKMPNALTAKNIHISQVTALCESSYDLLAAPPTEIDEISEKIGKLIAAEIPDGATLQLGIGAIPEAVGTALRNHKDLGIHTELLTDSMIGLIECGAVTNAKKPINTGVSVATIAFGTKRVYDYIDNNPLMAMLPVYYVNDPEVIAQHPNFISVNSAIEVDFYGQVCAESVGPRHISGSGGQLEYVRGAIKSEGGKSFIAFSSTATLPNGEVQSRIKPMLTHGAIVTTPKNEVDRIVTEYGIAELKSKTLSQRTRALIDIAHPDFRDQLLAEARNMNILI